MDNRTEILFHMLQASEGMWVAFQVTDPWGSKHNKHHQAAGSRNTDRFPNLLAH